MLAVKNRRIMVFRTSQDLRIPRRTRQKEPVFGGQQAPSDPLYQSKLYRNFMSIDRKGKKAEAGLLSERSDIEIRSHGTSVSFFN